MDPPAELGGHWILADSDYGYPHNGRRRKVMLWSRHPWTGVDRLGCETLPGGRFVTGVTETSVGRIRAVGVCIPWRDAHVRSGRRDRRPWENHAAYLDGLARVLTRFRRETGVVLLGDFNQRVPRRRNPVAVFDALLAATTGYEWATAGEFPELGGAVIDHIVHSSDLASLGRQAISAERANDTPLSDHPGVVATLALRGPST